MRMIKKMVMPVKLKKFYNEYNKRKFTLLDIGCGNHCPINTIKYFPKCEYYGLDREVYNNDNKDFLAMKLFYNIDLDKNIEKFAEIPDNSFDIVILAHIIEHLQNGLDVGSKSMEKVKNDGKIYIEWPSVKSLGFLPNKFKTLNFCDDKTHIRLYEISEIANLLLSKNFIIISAGIRRDIPRIIFLPIKIIYDLFKYGKIRGATFWDITGFANFIYAKKV